MAEDNRDYVVKDINGMYVIIPIQNLIKVVGGRLFGIPFKSILEFRKLYQIRGGKVGEITPESIRRIFKEPCKAHGDGKIYDTDGMVYCKECGVAIGVETAGL